MYSSPTDYTNHVYMARFYPCMIVRFEIDPFGKIYGEIQLTVICHSELKVT